MEKLQKLQNRALRIFLNMNNREHVSNLHNIIGLPLLKSRRVYHLGVYAFARTRVYEYLDVLPIVTRRRNAPLLKSFKSNYKVVDRSVYLQTATIWNSMDIDMRNTADLETFKKAKKKLLSDGVPPLVI